MKLDKLISQGAKLFFEETFSGNGRTCGTCHPANNNFTIDPAFIATRPANDPLFVAEFNPALAQLERPALMRSVRLDPGEPRRFQQSHDEVRDAGRAAHARPAGLTRAGHEPGAGAACGDDRLVRRWRAGNGLVARVRDRRRDSAFHEAARSASRAPTSSCRRSTSWMPWKPFSCRSAGDKDFDLSKITFRARRSNLNTGKNLFINGGGNPNFGGTCNFCHTNGGALSAGLQNQNRNFNTNVEDRLHPARTQVQKFPKDGGFGRTPTTGTAPSATARSTRHPWWKRQTPRRSSITTSRQLQTSRNPSKTPFASTSDPNSTIHERPLHDSASMTTQIDQLVASCGVSTRSRTSTSPGASSPKSSRTTATRDESRTRGYRRRSTRHRTGLTCSRQATSYPTAKSHLIAARNLISQAQVTEPPSQRRPLIQQAIAKLDRQKRGRDDCSLKCPGLHRQRRHDAGFLSRRTLRRRVVTVRLF